MDSEEFRIIEVVFKVIQVREKCRYLIDTRFHNSHLL